MAKVKDVIRDLSEYDLEDEILIAWWSADFVQEMAGDSIELTKEDFASIFDSEYDFSSINEQIDYEIGEVIKLREEEALSAKEDKELWDTEQENASVVSNTN